MLTLAGPLSAAQAQEMRRVQKVGSGCCKEPSRGEFPLL